MPRWVDHTGAHVNRVTFISFAGRENGNSMWLCRCDCGKEFKTRPRNVFTGATMSCGCLHREVCKQVSTKHGGSRTPEYRTLHQMRRRCNQERYRQYKDYGGRGIKICSRWMDSFENFLADMGPRPTPKHSIDRIDNDKGYWCGKPECPECGPAGREPNCRWATKSQQGNNRRTCRMVTHNGITANLKQWSKIIGVSYGTLFKRIAKGWTIERVLTPPSH